MHQIYPLYVSWILFGNAQKRLELSCVNATYLVRHLYRMMRRTNFTDFFWYFAGVFAFPAHLSKRPLSLAGVPHKSMGTCQKSTRSSRWPFYAGIVFSLLYTLLHEGNDIERGTCLMFVPWSWTVGELPRTSCFNVQTLSRDNSRRHVKGCVIKHPGSWSSQHNLWDN